ncbi:MAG: D-alanyl-D-alanine carboxypeptidase/D-alanyl-D-alanine-endopeptidase [Pseudomonadota bacterium]
MKWRWTLAAAALLPLLAVAQDSAQNPAAELPEPVRAALELRDVPADSVSVYVADVETGEVLVDWMADTPRNPASTLKLMTTLAALDILGPAHRWRTEVYALGPIEDGRLDGDLLLKGGGDPFLVTERVWQLTRDLRRRGLEFIDGDLLIDDSYFDVGAYDPGAFDRQPLRAYNVAPNALLMNFKVLRYRFTPERETRTVRIDLDPPLGNVNIDNRLRLRSAACGGFQRGIAINANSAVDTMTFSGLFPDRCRSYSMARTALSHNAYAYGLFSAMWRANGGRISGGYANVPTPPEVEPMLSFRSQPLGEAIARVNKYSNNVMARQLLYTLSAEVLGAPGTEEGGREVIRQWLTDKGLPLDSLAMSNGAGLSRDARVSARDMAAMLAFAWRQPYMPEYLASMALSGLDGTLRDRLRRAELRGKAHLKTGSLDHVAAIAGYLQSRTGRRYVVVALHNHKDIHRGYGEEMQEALMRWLYARR